MNTVTDIKEDISNIVIELYDRVALFDNKSDLNTTHEYLNGYIKRVSRIGLCIGKSNFTALRDSCVIFHDILNELSKNNELLSREQLEQFEIWPTLILAYIDDPQETQNIELLLALLENPIWPNKGNIQHIQELKVEFNIPDNTLIKDNDLHDEEALEEALEEEVTAGAFDGLLFESVQEEIIETMSGLISDLESTDEDDDFGLGHAFSLCADRIELLGMSIATAGLVGLMDVCNIFQSGLRELAHREKQLSDDEQLTIEEWTSYIIAYLSSPTDTDIVDQLVEYLNTIPWSQSMSEEEMMTLRLMLIPEDIEVTAPPESNDISLSEDINDYKNPIQEENELVYEMSNAEGLDEISISEDNYFVGQELIQLIKDEFQLEKSSLDDAVKDLTANQDLRDEDFEKISEFKMIIERFSLATESIGLSGLNNLLVQIISNLNAIVDKNITNLNKEIVDTFKQFSTTSLNYLNDMDNDSYINALISPYYLSCWPNKFEQEQSALAIELLSPKLIIEDDIEIRATQATIDDVSLKLPDDVNQQLLSTLLQELPIQTAEFTQSITQLVEGNASLNDVKKAQRIAHTLKGAANTVGIVGIATLTHHIEDIFNIFTVEQRLPGKNLSDILMNAADVLEMMSEALLGLGNEPEQAQNVLQQILDWANVIDQDGIPEDDAQIKTTDVASINTTNTEDMSHLNDVNAQTMLRVPSSLMDELLRIAGESIILGGQLQERLRKATEQTQLVHEQNTLYQQLVFELEQIVDVQGLSTKSTTLKTNEVFDSLELEQYNELHTVTHRLVEAATDSKELTHNIEDELNTLDNLLVDQSRLHKENQTIVMQTRMVPVKNIVPRLQRNIRQTSRTTCKKVNLNVVGEETLMDSDVLDELIDPLMHLLRNAVDHGIETESVREDKQKSPTGNIDLSFARDGDHIVVKCKDDGAGLNFDSIRTSAVKKELIGKNQNISDDELARFIWLAGFTTREVTTQVSGRGIGMDAVYNQITSMKGIISITSEKDEGCNIEIRLPLTLISVHAVLIKIRKQTIAISNRGIEQILCPGDGELIRDNDSYEYHLNDEIYTAYDIETLIHQPRDHKNEDSEERTVFILKDETGNKYAITVDHVIANQDLIVKQLGAYIPDIMGIEGATILGDGSIAPVLDLPGLIRTISKNVINPLLDQSLAQPENQPESLTALIVDDSLSARRVLAEFVKDLGYEIREARDGIEAIEVIENEKPDIILVDLEMPRMNGLELSSHVRSTPDTKDIPIIMITSRSTEKHREMADAAGVNVYLTKPFSEDELLENIENLLLTIA